MRILVTLLIGTLAVGAALAQEARRPAAGGNDATLGRLQAQLQQLASENAALQADNARLKEQVGKLEQSARTLATEKDSLSRRVGSAESKVGRAEAQRQDTSTRLASTEDRLKEVVGKYKELVEQLRLLETERNELAARANQDSQALRRCAQNNLALGSVANEALDRYQQKGCFGALAQAEPFTGLKRVEIENAVDESRQQIDALKITDTTAGPQSPDK